jgi:L-serine dehydratase
MVFGAAGIELMQTDYYSFGGGFVVPDADAAVDRLTNDDTRLPYPF